MKFKSLSILGVFLLALAAAITLIFWRGEMATEASSESVRTELANIPSVELAESLEEIVEIGRLKTSAERVAALKSKLINLSNDDFRAVMSRVLEVYGKDLRFLKEVFHEWCQIDPEAALKWVVVAMPNSREGRLLAEKASILWLDREPHAALAWMREQPDARKSKWSLFANALSKLARDNPEGFLAQLNNLGGGKVIRLAQARAFEDLFNVDPNAAFHYLGEKMHGTHEFYNALQEWGKTSPRDSLNWIVGYGDKHDKVVVHLLAMSASKNPAAFLGELILHPSYKNGEMTPVVAYRGILRDWASNSPEAVSDWLGKMQNKASRDALAREVLSGELYTGNDYQIEYKWKIPFADALLDPEAKRKIYKEVVGEWAYQDAQAAQQWAQSTNDQAVINAAYVASIGGLAKTNPAAALEMYSKLGNDSQRNEAASELVIGWSQTDPASATKWAFSNTDAATSGNVSQTNFALAKWAETDAAAAVAWVNSTITPPSGAATAMAEAVISLKGHEAAANTMLGLTDAAIKTSGIEYVYNQWSLVDSASADRWKRGLSGK